MRLIDADALQESFQKIKKDQKRLVDVAQIIELQAVIDSQPIAYDVDDVMDNLKSKMEHYRTEASRCLKCGYRALSFDYKGRANGFRESIRIVKSGFIKQSPKVYGSDEQ